MSTQELDRSMLDAKDREELHAIAGAMGVKAPTRMRKAELIDAILDAAEGGDTSDSGNGRSTRAARGGDDQLESASGPASPDAGRRTIRSTRASEVEQDTVAALAAEEDALAGSEPVADAESILAPRPTRPPATPEPQTNAPAPEGQSTPAGPSGDYDDEHASYGDANNRRRRRRRGRGGTEGEPRGPQEPIGEPVEIHGLLELRDEGYGFLRTTGYLAGSRDVYVSASQVRRFALRKGDFIHGFSRPQASNEKYPALLRVDHINTMTPDDARSRPRFEDRKSTRLNSSD